MIVSACQLLKIVPRDLLLVGDFTLIQILRITIQSNMFPDKKSPKHHFYDAKLKGTTSVFIDTVMNTE